MSRRRKTRTCRGKVRYHDKPQAVGAMHAIQGNRARGESNRQRTPCRAYYCDACKGWHLTSRRTWHG